MEYNRFTIFCFCCTKNWISCMFIYIPSSFEFPSHLDHHRALSRVPCAIQWVLTEFSSVTQSCPTLCDPVNHSTPGLPVHHQLPEFTQTHPLNQWCHPTILSSVVPFSPPALNLSQHQGLFKWVSSSHQVAKVLEFQLQHQSFQWTPRTDLV